MTSADERASLFQEIERAERTLGNLLQRLSSINTSLETVESNMRVNDFTMSGMYVPGSANGIVCALTGDIRGDPIRDALENLKGKGFRLPVIIKGSDRSESKATCNSIMKTIGAHLKLTKTKLIINLRWSTLSPDIDSSDAVVLGTRYKHGSKREILMFKEKLIELNLQVFEDEGEFGGGLLTYKLAELAKEIGDVAVMEVTLSSTLAQNIPKIAEILKAVTTP